MSQFMSQSLSQQMRMEQRLTPQLIQSMSILQKGLAELDTYLSEALESNAALELAEQVAAETPPSGGDEPVGDSAPAQADEVSFNHLDRFSRENELDYDNRAPHPSRRVQDSGEPDAKMAALANAAGRSVTLQAHLVEQLVMLDLTPEVRCAAERIIDHVDPDGLLRVRLEEVAESSRPVIDVKILEEALEHVQTLEPVGVGARDMVESLLLQIDALPGDNQMERTLIQDHLQDLAQNRLPTIAKDTGYSVGEIQEAIKVLRSKLTLHPGLVVGDHSVPTIRPDVIVDYADTGGGLTIQLTRGNTPKLRISEKVAELARSSANGKADRDFARSQVEAAAALIDAVEFRRSRLLEVSKSIVETQRDFFDIGPDGLKAWKMCELAEVLECDPSTISRTVADKYMQTPRGIYPLRYFFSGGTTNDDGESVGWNSVKARVKDLIEAEDRTKPLKDDQITVLLKKEGIVLSRRTVAKYRGQLDIPTARQRREF